MTNQGIMLWGSSVHRPTSTEQNRGIFKISSNKSILNVPLVKIQLHGDLKKKLKKNKNENMRNFFFHLYLTRGKMPSG